MGNFCITLYHEFYDFCSFFAKIKTTNSTTSLTIWSSLLATHEILFYKNNHSLCKCVNFPIQCVYVIRKEHACLHLSGRRANFENLRVSRDLFIYLLIYLFIYLFISFIMVVLVLVVPQYLKVMVIVLYIHREREE